MFGRHFPLCMDIRRRLRKDTECIAGLYPPPKITRAVIPPFFPGGQPRRAEFMALALEDGSVGISFVLVDDDFSGEYEEIRERGLVGRDPVELALRLGSDNQGDNMVGMAALNAIHQHAMSKTGVKFDYTTDAFGLLDIGKEDKLGMVGFFPPLVPMAEEKGADLVVLERRERVVKENPKYKVSLDPACLRDRNKVLVTSTTVLNGTIDEVLENTGAADMVSVLGPTAGYFPDPLFERGVDVVGGRQITDPGTVLDNMEAGKRWGPGARKYCWLRSDYPGMDALVG